MNKTKPLCYAPFIGMYAVSSNKYAPCCVSSRIKAESPVTFWLSSEMQSIRKELLSHTWPATCTECKHLAENNLTYETDYWDSEFTKCEVEIDVVTGNNLGHPLVLDYRPSNLCNLKCRMCVPQASSQWETEVQQHPKLAVWFDPVYKNKDNFNQILEYILSIKLYKLKLLGGEPTIDPNILSILEHVKLEYTTLPILRFTTNATNITPKFKQIISQFDTVDIALSIDGTSSTFNYIRTNAVWENVQRNVYEIFDGQIATTVAFNTVITPYTLFNIIELLDWFYVLHNKGYHFVVNFFTSSDNKTSINAILANDMHWLITQVQEWLYGKDIQFTNRVNGILPILNSAVFDISAYNDFINYNSLLDEIRNTRLLELNPLFTNYSKN